MTRISDATHCPSCGHGNRLNGEIVHASNCPVKYPPQSRNSATPTDEREELIKDLRHFAAAYRGEGKEIEADVMDEAADALAVSETASKPGFGRDDESGLRQLPMYRAALYALCVENGGEILVKCPEDTPAGTLMNRNEEDGIRFKWVPDGSPHYAEYALFSCERCGHKWNRKVKANGTVA